MLLVPVIFGMMGFEAVKELHRLRFSATGPGFESP
jgi:hypothetical protein